MVKRDSLVEQINNYNILDLAIKRSWSAMGHHFTNSVSTKVLAAAYQVLRPSLNGSGGKFLKVLQYMGLGAILVM